MADRQHRFMMKALDTIMVAWYKRPELSLGELLILAAERENRSLKEISDVDLLEGTTKIGNRE